MFRLGPCDINNINDMLLHSVMETSDSEGVSTSSDDELLFWVELHMCHHLQRMPTPAFHGPRVEQPWKYFSGDVFKSLSRFEVEDFPVLVSALNFPVNHHDRWAEGCVRSVHDCVASKSLAIFLVLRRLSVPDRWGGLCWELQCTRQWAKQIFTETMGRLYNTYQKLITRIDLFRVAPLLASYANAVSAKGALVPNCVCFIDGKYTRTCKPSLGPQGSGTDYQWLFYNGHYGHGIKSQHIVLLTVFMSLLPEQSKMQTLLCSTKALCIQCSR